MSIMTPPPPSKTEKLISKLEKNLPPAVVAANKPPVVLRPAPTDELLMSEAEEDYQYSRDRIKKLLKVSDEALETLLIVAGEAEHPRAYEVLATVLKTSADVTEQLIRLQKQRRELAKMRNGGEDEGHHHGGEGAKVGIFIGTTADLQKQLAADSSITVVSTPIP